MMAMTTKAVIVSEGTLRPEDLIPRFLAAARHLAKEAAAGDIEAAFLEIVEAELSEIHRRIEGLDVDAEYWDSEEAGWDLDYLLDLLDLLGEAAPEGYRFGAHEGDGALFGFWPVEEEVAE